jgi:ubiquinone/menaquinone biosynthesis C-methylase UbiE
MVGMPEMSALARGFCSSPPYGALARWVLLPWGLQGFAPAGEALEIGSGSGAMAAQLLRKFPDLRVVATDYDPEMVATAERRLGTFGARAMVQRVDATALPFADERFDVVLSFAMLHHVGDWEQAVAEAVRVLRPGGHLVGYDLLHPAAAHHSHRDMGGSTRLMGPGQVETLLHRLPVTDVRLRRAARGFALKFMATRRV